MRIGILGGTFNPIHNGHLQLARQARRRLKLDKIIFVPANISPHKPNIPILSARERYKMVAMAIGRCPYFDISDYEIKTGGVSYSVKTLRAFRKKFGGRVKLFFLAGSDSLEQLRSWKNIAKIIKLAEFVVASRPGYPPPLYFNRSDKKKWWGIRFISVPTPDISSTIIRQRLKEGLSVKRYLPSAVCNYINKKRFYR